MRTIFCLLTCLVTTMVHTQLTGKEPGKWNLVGKLKFGSITKASLEYRNTCTDTTCLLFVKDSGEQPKDNYFSIAFKNTGGTFSNLYTILKSFCLDENKRTGNTAAHLCWVTLP